MSQWHVAKINVARLRAPIDDPAVAEFVAGLEPVNRLADDSPGFVWRLQTEDGDATAVRAYDDELVVVNMSVWASLEQLADFVYRSGHSGFLRRKREWFERIAEAHMALWWVEAGCVPSVEEGTDRLQTLRTAGPSAAAFTFRHQFPPPDGPEGITVDERNTCPA